MEQNVKSELGTIRIHKKVISSIAINATKEVVGVAGLGRSFKGILSNFLGFNPSGSIEVNIDSNNEVSVSIPLVVAYGYNLPEIAALVQENVRKMIEKSTDLNIKQIDVNIQAVEKEVKSENSN